ncbi:MAG TPA: S41 family peptidase [Stackebrandtia sp.]|jgi:tricorn protease|uniref:S41 family peptidase n=1 Tax=Stackebrandtia sp. TaxID=2023065 RepID=UPI002D682BCB|nr:S41 family peptidase [Stackebrandtia sp.]HZE40481.1 S41 family peptidase [Stackebrandtia sp.]
MADGYPRFPAIHDDTIVYVAEDDLWTVPADGGVGRRITAGRAAATHPRISPDGTLVAYSGAEEGPSEVYVVPLAGGESRRLTFEGGDCGARVVAWSADGTRAVYSTSAYAPHLTESRLREVPVAGGPSVDLRLGHALSASFGDDGTVVLGREYWNDPAYWKRYRGGTAGQLWIDAGGDGEFRKLITLDGNLSRPCVIGERVYFLSDHEGHGNVYSTDFAGRDLRRHSDHEEFYARGLSGDGRRLVYHCGGRLYLLDPSRDQPRALDVDTGLTRTQRARKFVEAADYLGSVDLSPDASRLAVSARGKAFTFGTWEGPVTQHGEPDGVRYRLVTWLHDNKRLVAVAADSGEREVMVGLHADMSVTGRRLEALDLGSPTETAASPVEGKIAVANNRGELILVDVDGDVETSTVVDSSDRGRIRDLAFSPDGRWLAYARPESHDDAADDAVGRSAIRLAEVATGRTLTAARRVLSDGAPSFDPAGKFLYFIGHRRFNPSYDTLHFDLNFPMGGHPYAIALEAATLAPFVPGPKALHDTATADATTDTAVEPDGLDARIVPFPVGDSDYRRVFGVDGKALVLSYPVRGQIAAPDADDTPQGMLDAVDLVTGKVERIADGVGGCAVTPDGKSLVYTSGKQLRVVKATEKAPETAEYNRESGWVDLSRVKVSVRPEFEWPQMFRETWRRLADHFWTEDMSGVDWRAMYDRYAPLVSRVSTRGELSDVLWELMGELGTSHAYERAGDLRKGPQYRQGFLGAEFDVDARGRHTIAAILEGDASDPLASSPLSRPGVDARVGDEVVAINGLAVGAGAGVAQRLVNLAGQQVRVALKRGDAAHAVVVTPLADERALRYRAWVDANRSAVHQATRGRVGYVHIPDMMAKGFAEFHRGFLNEYDREALVVDVRFNGGGHVSSVLVEKLLRRRLGHIYSRWERPAGYPYEAPRGPMVALINEFAGSDGDIFSNAFRGFGLGPLIGARTWGGVIGMDASRPGLSDGTMVSQPEFSFHFDNVQWGVENHGVAPDIDVDNAPQDYAAGRDPQLERGIAEVTRLLERTPAHRPTPTPRPVLAPPPLPPRP